MKQTLTANDKITMFFVQAAQWVVAFLTSAVVFVGTLPLYVPGIFIVSVAILFFRIPVLSAIIIFPYKIITRVLRQAGILKDTHRWSIVYDSVTKDPIDPAYVTVRDMLGNEVATAVTDLDGRFGILLPQGFYMITVQKTNYVFPSQRLYGKSSDGYYQGLYFGERFEVVEREQALALNIPMDSVGEGDWNQKEKKRKGIYFYSGQRKEFATARMVYFTLGLIFLLAHFVITPVSSATYILLCVYGAILIFSIIQSFFPGDKYYHSLVVDKQTGKPLAFARVHIFSAKNHYELSKKTTSFDGQFIALVPQGEYYITIEKRENDGTYVQVFTSTVFTVSGSYIGKKFEV